MRRLLVIVAVIAGLAGTAIAYAAAGRQLAAVPASSSSASATRSVSTVVVVPDVRREAFVFAKEQLQDAGFSWKVTGSVEGYAANTVLTQSPTPGTKLVDTGAPLVKLTLARNRQYKETGEAENTSPYAPTATKLAGSS